MSAVLDFAAKVAEKVAPTRPPEARRYDAGSKTARMSGWVTPTSDANSSITNPATIRARARDLVRNNAWASKGVNVITNNCVGYGIRAQLKAGSQLRTRQAQSIWQQWAETTACDADGMHDIYGLQAIAFRSLVESGEVLVRMRPRRIEDGLPLPFQIQLLEADMLADDRRAIPLGGNTIHNGIEFDSLGRRVAYHLYKTHPGSTDNVFGQLFNTDISRVDAREIIHIFRKDRPGQDRGVSWLAPVVRTLFDLGLYEDGTLKRVQLGSLFAGFISSDDPSAFGDELDDELPDLQPGTMYMLKPGQSVQFNSPPEPHDPAFRDATLRAVAAGLGITYESLTGNLSEVNFSSARMGAHEMGRNLDTWLWNLFIPRFCNGVFGWFKDMLATAQGFNTSDLSVEWTPPARTLVDPAKEWKALQTAVRSGFMSLPEAIRSQGYDPDSVLAEQAEYLAKLDAAGVIVESDYRFDATPKVTADTEQPTGDPNAGN